MRENLDKRSCIVKQHEFTKKYNINCKECKFNVRSEQNFEFYPEITKDLNDNYKCISFIEKN